MSLPLEKVHMRLLYYHVFYPDKLIYPQGVSTLVFIVTLELFLITLLHNFGYFQGRGAEFNFCASVPDPAAFSHLFLTEWKTGSP